MLEAKPPMFKHLDQFTSLSNQIESNFKQKFFWIYNLYMEAFNKWNHFFSSFAKSKDFFLIHQIWIDDFIKHFFQLIHFSASVNETALTSYTPFTLIYI